MFKIADCDLEQSNVGSTLFPEQDHQRKLVRRQHQPTFPLLTQSDERPAFPLA